MNGFLKNIDAKMIREAGLFLALMATLFVIYKVTTNDIAHVERAVLAGNAQAVEVQKETNEVLRNLEATIAGNTKIMESLLRQR